MQQAAAQIPWGTIQLGHYKEALKDFGAALKTCSHVSRAGCNRARLLDELGKYKEANKAWSDLIAKSDAATLVQLETNS